MPPPTIHQRLIARQRPLSRRPVMQQQWRDLLFIHWEFDPDLIQQSLPSGLTVDLYQGKAYLGVVPFFMRNVRPSFLPAVPGISNFLELNLRTYVYDRHGRPGVWFYSLDANQYLAVKVARRFFNLPYFYAAMSAEKNNGITYSSHRRGCDAASDSSFFYQMGIVLPEPDPESLEFFLIERYLLFALNQSTRSLFVGQVYHPPYRLHAGTAEIRSEGILSLSGFKRPERDPDHIVLSPGVDVEIFPVQRVE